MQMEEQNSHGSFSNPCINPCVLVRGNGSQVCLKGVSEVSVSAVLSTRTKPKVRPESSLFFGGIAQIDIHDGSFCSNGIILATMQLFLGYVKIKHIAVPRAIRTAMQRAQVNDSLSVKASAWSKGRGSQTTFVVTLGYPEDAIARTFRQPPLN